MQILKFNVHFSLSVVAMILNTCCKTFPTIISSLKVILKHFEKKYSQYN